MYLLVNSDGIFLPCTGPHLFVLMEPLVPLGFALITPECVSVKFFLNYEAKEKSKLHIFSYQKGNVASRTLQLHGLWPDYGSTYGTYGTPISAGAPSYSTAYESWSQYCSPNWAVPGSPDYSKCHVNGDLCPENITKTQVFYCENTRIYFILSIVIHPIIFLILLCTVITFIQFNYDNCMAKYNIQPCVTPPEVLSKLGNDFKTYAAGYLGSNGSFLLHEFTKHGSCISTKLLFCYVNI